MQTVLQKTGKSFTDCSTDERDEILKEMESIPLNPDRYIWGNRVSKGEPNSFYRQLKGQILFAYFSSEQVGKQVFSYDPVPGKFVGCIPLAEVGNAWTE